MSVENENASSKVLIGVVIPAYNAARTLVSTLDSIDLIKRQVNEAAFYCVLIDDCSEDNTKSIATDYLDNGIIDQYYRCDGNHGVSAARNRGVGFCEKTDYILFCDADDTLDIEGFKQQCLDFNSDLILFNHYRKSDDANRLIAYHESPPIS